ncbi:MAG TPA: carboxypeptidase regulatory-like domain-containing protein [Candidatus Sulfotelmatobacter sp.]|nr:carboxypeptidase regulatory-like domain-containing protein [Candidatus Sulfotelmatobacter sp.]
MRFERFPIVLVALLTLSLATAPLFGQSLTTGNINGTVTDPSNAVVPNATVNLKSLDTGMTATTTTNASGGYNFGLLKPGRYMVTVKQGGFAEVAQTLQVQVGQTSKIDLQLSVAKGTETVEVSGTAPLINTEPSTNTAYTEQQVAQLPSAGGDITNIADTAPGAVVNGTGGYGNFTVNGLPATSNLFTVNGENDMDPYFNINNSGATNLTLGQNEISEATVITNPYGGQYGQLAGAQVTYVTKSGTNQFHGNALYWWNGRLLNANNWINKESQEYVHNFVDPTQPANQPAFANANQWATSFGGPIIKNHTFFFVDFEGTRFLLPNVDSVTAPSTQFINAAEAQVAAMHPAESPDYNKLMSFWQNAPGYNTASPIPTNLGDCSTLVLPGFNAGTDPCGVQYIITPKALAHEYILGVRVDQKLGNNDNLFGRYKLDHGLQPTSIDPINALFDANSNQPSWDAQASETHVFGQTKTNQFTATLSHYVAIFSSATAASTFNYGQAFASLDPYNFTSPNAAAASFPQGRNITQYQFIDDFSWTRGNHTLKFGENFRRYDVSDHNFFFNSPLVYWGYGATTLQQFAQGEAFQYRKAYIPNNNNPIAFWGLGAYAQDEWKATHNLKLTLALRLEHNSNPVCQNNCFSNLFGPFANSASVKAEIASGGTGGSLDVPYSSDLNYGQHNGYPGVDSIVWSPRLGFSWDVLGTGKTVVSGGIGQFYDNPAVGMVDNILGFGGQPPVSVMLRVRSSPVTAGVLPFDPNGAPATWAASAAAFNITESYSQIQGSLPAGVVFAPPAGNGIIGTIHAPEWQEWNLSVQQQLDRNTVFIVNYVGNHGARISYSNAWPNAYDIYGLYEGTIPTAPAAYDYSNVTEYKQGAVSNYNGLTFSLARQFNHWIAGHLNYTWSHNIDESSNGGLFQYGFEGTNTILGQIYPTSLRTDNYGNSDYDVRHLVNADFVVNPEFHKTGALKWVTEGWQFSGKMFWRTGLPYTIADGNLTGTVNYGGDTIPATIIGNAQPTGCSKTNATFDATVYPVAQCLAPSAILDANSPTWFGEPYPIERRNQYRGPHYFDMDLNLFKNFKIGERFNFAIGAQAFNAFNHPNFGLPNATYGSTYTGAAPIPDPSYGTIGSMQGTPTSPYGNFLGFDSSPRVMQLSAKIVF